MTMHPRLRFALLAPLLALAGCGGSSSNSGTGITYTANTGDYVITVAGGTKNVGTFTGNLTISNTSASGVFRYNNVSSVCVPATQDIPFTGTITNGVLTLTSSAFVSSVATLSLPLPFSTVSGGAQLSNGTAVINGGTCALASTTAQAQYVPSLAGTYTATLTGPASGTGTFTFTEGAADADGQFPATGAVTFTSTASPQCNFSVPVSAPISGFVSGTSLQVANTGGTISISANATSSPTAVSVSYLASGVSSACQGTYTGNVGS